MADPNRDMHQKPLARSTVLNTTELLEHILLNMDMRDLLLAQRINKHFKAIIDNSIAIQRALYFMPAPSKTKDGTSIVPISNPFLQLQGPVMSPQAVFIFSDFDEFEGAQTPFCLTIDAISATHDSTDSAAPTAFTASISVHDGHGLDDESIPGISGAPAFHFRGSWRKMLATQPYCPLLLPHWDAVTQGGVAAGRQTMGTPQSVERYMTDWCRMVGDYLKAFDAGKF